MLYSSDPSVTVASLRKNYTVPTRNQLQQARGGGDTVGARWAPIHHADLIEQIHSAAQGRGLQVVNESFQLSDDGHDIFGHMQFETPSFFSRRDMGPVLGFRSSNMQRFGLLGVTGSRVFVCSNGVIAGDFVFGCKHTTGNVTRLDAGIKEGMGHWEAQARKIAALVDHLQGIELSEADADHLIMAAVRSGVYSAAQTGKVDQTYRAFAQTDNRYNEAFGPRNAWSLYNAVTEVAKGGHDGASSSWSPARQEKAMKMFPRVVDPQGVQGLMGSVSSN